MYIRKYEINGADNAIVLNPGEPCSIQCYNIKIIDCFVLSHTVAAHY